MSVALQSPFSGTKRLFEADSELEGNQQQEGTAAAVNKRARCSPAGRCRPAVQSSPSQFYQGIPSSTVAAVKALFPDMDEQVVEHVLSECGQDIDAAIRRLTQLKLGAEQATAAAAAGSPPAGAAAGAGSTQHPSSAAAAATNGNAGDAQAQQQQQGAAACGPQTADQWVDVLVQEMAAAKDFSDARGRAGKLLQAFEQFVTARSKDQGGAGPSSAAGRLEEVVRENGILKRAVQIQNAKLQELGSNKDQEIASLKAMLGQYQERLRHLELSNYSLALHLQRATDSQSQPTNRPPDVF